MILSVFVFSLIALWRIGLMVLGACLMRKPIAKLQCPDILPKYTILLPVYKEEDVLEQLCIAMHALRYPKNRLEIFVLVEEDDNATYKAACQLPWPGEALIIRLPKGLPKTKPRALNVGLALASGSFLTIYDAEDRPHPEQLLETVSVFSNDKIGCVQAPLCADQSAIGWLGGQWALEYAMQFGLLQPALARLGLPIMLGGTSNHFRTNLLREMGGWDAWNVTEDAELGIRFAREGLKIATIKRPTLEAPPEQTKVWLGQRSRWIKGFMQTWGAYCKHLKQGQTNLTLTQYFSIWAILGGMILSSFFYLPGLIMLSIAALCGVLDFWMILPLGLMIICAFPLGILAPGVRDSRRVWLAMTQSLYWPLHTLGAFLALKCFLNCPHFWNKTQHKIQNPVEI